MTGSVITKQIAKNIKAYRKRHGFTQAYLAELIDMEKISVTRIESGEHNIYLKNLERLAEIFNISFIDLIRENSSEIQAQAEHITDILQGLESEERDAILRIVKDIVLIRKNK